MSNVAELNGVLTPGDFRNEEFQDPRRREPRTACDKTIHIHFDADEASDDFLPAKVVDCSTRGLGLVVPRAMEWGERFVAKLQLEKTLLLIYEARYSRDAGGKKFRIGAEFVGFAAGKDSMNLKEVLGAVLKSHDSAKSDAPANTPSSSTPIE